MAHPIMDNNQQAHSTPFDSSRYAKRIHDVLSFLGAVQKSLAETNIIPGGEYNKDYQPSLSPPKILVLGNKFAGKTSLVYTLAQLPIKNVLPTWCPVEIRLCRPTEWEIPKYRYIVFLELQPSTDQTTNETFMIGSTNDIAEAEQYLMNAHDWIKNNNESMKALNIFIVVKINGATLDLILVDLPSLNYVQLENSQNATSHTITYAEFLQSNRSYKRPGASSNMYLVVSPVNQAETDVEILLNFPNTWDPELERTIGVFTKPNLSSIRDPPSLLSSSPLMHGFFVTSIPLATTETMGSSWDSICKQDEILDATIPWSAVDKSCRGTLRLVECIVDLLDEILKKEISNLMAEIQRNMNLIQSQLDSLPRNLLIEPRACLKTLFLDFERDMNNHLKFYTLGGPIGKELLSLDDSFRLSIPLFDLLGDGSDIMTTKGVDKVTNAKVISYHQIHEMLNVEADMRKLGATPVPISQQLKGSVRESWEKIYLVALGNIYNQLLSYILEETSKGLASFGSPLRNFVIETIKATMNRMKDAVQSEINKCLLMTIYYSQDDEECSRIFQDFWSKLFIQWGDNEYSTQITFRSSKKLIRQLKNSTTSGVSEDLRAKVITERVEGALMRAKDFWTDQKLQIIGKVVQHQREDKRYSHCFAYCDSIRRLRRNIPELDIMAEVGAWLVLSVPLVAETVKMQLRENFVENISQTIGKSLQNQLDQASDEKCINYAYESSTVRKRREYLTKRRNILSDARIYLTTLIC